MGRCLWTAVTNYLLFIPQLVHEHGQPWWYDIDRANRRTRRKTCPSVTFPPQIRHGLTRERTWTSAVKSQRITNCLRLAIWTYSITRHCRLGGVVVNMLATGPKGCGFEPGQGDGFLRAIKIRSTPSSRMGSKAGRSHVVRFYGM
jgi:hypothetical protein